MNKAFTLIELLVVMMIMAMMGTAALGGYRAMQRGMEEKGVIQNANAMIRAAYQRAQIDRQPTIVYFWNETLQSRTEDENEIVVGKAVAIRRHGRLSNVFGELLIDEFADLNHTYTTIGDDDSDAKEDNDQDVMYLYPMDKLTGTLRRSLVSTVVHRNDDQLVFFTGQKTGTDSANEVPSYGFKLVDAKGVQWKAGTSYGFEFLSVQLPHGYIFGSNYSTDAGNPITDAGSFIFKPGINSGNGITTGGSVGTDTITIYSLRPSGATMKAEKVGTTDKPDQKL